MSEAYIVAVEGLSALRSLDSIPAEVKRAALQAVNRTADRTRTSSARSMREQVNFPASYLSPSGERLAVSKRATRGDLEATITGRHRPTSLARFSSGGAVGSRTGVRVEVAPEFSKFMRRAFLVRLRAGSADIDTKSNLGLAIRLKPGERVENKKRIVQMGNGLALLYGPSIDQIFRSVADDEAPGAADFLEAEFLRLLEVNK